MSTTYGSCALQFPSNYVLIDAEEMEYIDGGGVGQSVAYYTVKVGLNVAVNAAFGGGTLSLVRQLTKTAKDQLLGALKQACLKWTTARVANLIVGSALGTILDVGLGNVGGVMANWLDKKDGTVDKQIYFSNLW